MILFELNKKTILYLHHYIIKLSLGYHDDKVVECVLY